MILPNSPAGTDFSLNTTEVFLMTTALLVCALATLEVTAVLFLARTMPRRRWPWPRSGFTNNPTPAHKRRRT